MNTHTIQRKVVQAGSFVALAAAALSLQPALAAMPSAQMCGVLANGDNGPFDYRGERRDLLVLGERFHFTPKVEALISGQSGYKVGEDIAFILRMFPNHHRALVAMMRWGERKKTLSPDDTQYPVECYFERALRFRPDDNIARMIYATFLTRQGRLPEAEAQLDYVAITAGDNAFTHYNVGMQYLELKLYDKAVSEAQAAQRLGFPATDLRDKLRAAGKWQDTAAVPPPAASAASAAAAS